MSAALLPAPQRNVVLFILASAAAAMAFGTVMLTSPPTRAAAVAGLSDDGVIPPVTNCEFLPTGHINSCTVYR
jgi:hypothetical protein